MTGTGSTDVVILLLTEGKTQLCTCNALVHQNRINTISDHFRIDGIDCRKSSKA